LDLEKSKESPIDCSGTEKRVLHLSYVLSKAGETVPKTGLNVAVSYPHCNLDMASAVEAAAPKVPPAVGFGWKVMFVLDESKLSTANTKKLELKLDDNIWTLQDTP
jgi:hypothetical protein